MTLEATTTTDGEQVYTDRTQTERGADGPFYTVFADPDGTDRGGSVVAAVTRSTPRWIRWAGSSVRCVVISESRTSGTRPTS